MKTEQQEYTGGVWTFTGLCERRHLQTQRLLIIPTGDVSAFTELKPVQDRLRQWDVSFLGQRVFQEHFLFNW